MNDLPEKDVDSQHSSTTNRKMHSDPRHPAVWSTMKNFCENQVPEQLIWNQQDGKLATNRQGAI
jgi:hypothetical protein